MTWLDWWREQTGRDWLKMRNQAMDILAEESRLSQIVKLVGPDVLPDEQRLVLETARLLREGFLQQNAMDPIDAFSPVDKQVAMLGLILFFHQRSQRVLRHGAHIGVIHNMPVVNEIIRMKTEVSNEELDKLDVIRKHIEEQTAELEMEYQ